jgi:hypothetical protein
MRKCLFCSNAAESREHVLPQWLFRRIYPGTKGAFPVQVARYVEGKGYCDERRQISLSFQARIVCTSCNTGWLSKLESEVLKVLEPLTEPRFPVLAHCYFDELRKDAALLARWACKTALTTSFALPGNQRLPTWLASEIGQGRVPKGLWLHVAKAKVGALGAALRKTFLTFNGGVFAGVQSDKRGECFHFSLQVNQFLLGVGLSPGAEVGCLSPGELVPFRIFPKDTRPVPENFEFDDINHYLHCVGLRTWAGCPGEVPA